MTDLSHKKQVIPSNFSSFETIDLALNQWLDETLDVQATTNEGVKKVPVVWFSQERAHQIKAQNDNRDQNGFLDFPQILFQRTGATLTAVNDRPLPGIIRSGDYKNNQFGFWKRVSQNKTKNFARTVSQKEFNQPNMRFKNPEVVNEFVFVPYPAYYDMKYDISLKAIYMQQINEMIAPFQRFAYPYNSGIFTIHYDGFKFEAFIPKETNFASNATDLGENEKLYEAKFSITVLGFTTTSDVSQTTPNLVYREGPAKFRLNRERTIIGDINNIGDIDTPFRE